MKEQRKVMVGRVVSNKMDKTAVVAVETLKRHRLYGKVIRQRKKHKAHDAENQTEIGDLVRIVESRPLSKEKRWVITEIIERKGVAEPTGAPELEALEEPVAHEAEFKYEDEEEVEP